MVGAVGEMASMKRLSCGRRGRMGCVAPAVPSKLGQVPCHCFCCLFCVVGYPPNWGKWPRYIDRIICFFLYNIAIISTSEFHLGLQARSPSLGLFPLLQLHE